jgi:hypothetical protein
MRLKLPSSTLQNSLLALLPAAHFVADGERIRHQGCLHPVVQKIGGEFLQLTHFYRVMAKESNTRCAEADGNADAYQT